MGSVESDRRARGWLSWRLRAVRCEHRLHTEVFRMLSHLWDTPRNFNDLITSSFHYLYWCVWSKPPKKSPNLPEMACQKVKSPKGITTLFCQSCLVGWCWPAIIDWWQPWEPHWSRINLLGANGRQSNGFWQKRHQNRVLGRVILVAIMRRM